MRVNPNVKRLQDAAADARANPHLWTTVEDLYNNLISSGLAPADYASHAAAAAAVVPADKTFLRTAGFHTAGDGGGAQYKEVGNKGPVLPWQFRSNGGARRWQIVPNADGSVATKQFGARHDFDGKTGTDDTAAIQACIDFTIYSGERCKAILSPGGAMTTNTIHLGYGDSFYTVHLEGANAQPGGNAGRVGSGIYPQFSDRPGIAVSGARMTRLQSITEFGKNFSWIAGNGLGRQSPLLDDKIPANWLDPTLHQNADSRYAPYAGVAIDPFAGPRPPVSYPDMAYPAYAGNREQYGKHFSSDVHISDCFIAGFVVGVVVQPCDDDGNGDFVRIANSQLPQSKYGLSIGNTQSRNVSMLNVFMAQSYCCLTNTTHGRQNGRVDGPMTNCQMANAIKVFDLNGSSVGGPITFDQCYGEEMYRLGDIGGGTSAESSLVFNACRFEFHSHTDRKGRPANVLNQWFGAPMSIDFNNCAFGNYADVICFNSPNVRFNGCVTVPKPAYSTDWERLAAWGTCGGLIVSPDGRSEGKLQDMRGFTVTPDGKPAICNIRDGQVLSSRAAPIPVHARYAVPAGSAFGEQLKTPQMVSYISKRGFSAFAISKRTLSATFASPRPDWLYMVSGPLPGDVLFDAETQTVFWVMTRSGDSVTAKAMNNYIADGGGDFELMAPLTTSADAMWCFNTRIFTPEYPVFGDTAAGSAEITNAGRADGVGSFIATEIVPGDQCLVDGHRDSTFNVRDTRVVSSRASSVTLAGGAARTTTAQRYPFWVRGS